MNIASALSLNILMSLLSALPQKSSGSETNADLRGSGGNVSNMGSNTCVVETLLLRTRGLIIREGMPKEFPNARTCRTTLRSPGNILQLKLDFAILNSKDDFIQITTNTAEIWYIHKSCAPCHEGAIEGNEIILEFRLSNHSRTQLRYAVEEHKCPLLAISPPLRMKNQMISSRRINESLELECLTERDFVLVGENKISCKTARNGPEWSAPLPSCRRLNNCPELSRKSQEAGYVMAENLYPGSSYHCSWAFEAEKEGEYVVFTPTFRPESLALSTRANRSRGLAFYDGEGRIRIENGDGLRYRSRDRKLFIYLNLSPQEAYLIRNGSFKVDFEIATTTCPTIDEESFPSGSLEFSRGHRVGSVVKFGCSPGFKLRGTTEATCSKTGDWTFGTIPQCLNVGSDHQVADMSTMQSEILSQSDRLAGKPRLPATNSTNTAGWRTFDRLPTLIEATQFLERHAASTAIWFCLLVTATLLSITFLCRTSGRNVQLRENPLYKGNTPKRLNNISFRPRSDSKDIRECIHGRTFS